MITAVAMLISGGALYAHARQKRLRAAAPLFKKDKPQPQATAWHTQPYGTGTITAGEPMRTNGARRRK